MIGITESGDAGLDFSWVDQVPLMDFSVLITKNLNDKFIKNVINQKEKIIVHATITGMGGSIVEPKVPKPEWSLNQLKKLINSGFPAEQIVLRVDPIIPTESGINLAVRVIKAASGLGIRRCRISVLDLYKHVAIRFENAGIPVPNYNVAESYQKIIKALTPYMNEWEFEACAENVPFKLGCISQKDADILNSKVTLIGNKGQRRGCLCPRNKHELLTHRSQCPHGCLYCYWSSDYVE
jgi:DNA repair photolyase